MNIFLEILHMLRLNKDFLFIIFVSFNLMFSSENFELDELDDLKLNSISTERNNLSTNSNTKKMILLDDNIYLLDDDFDFGDDEYELQKLELNPNEIETAKAYEDFLNAFFQNSIPIGTIAPNSNQTLYNKDKKSTITKKSKPIRNMPNPSSFSPNRPSRGAMGFGVSTVIGATIPVTMNGFAPSSNMGLRIDTPVSFNLAGFEAILGTDIYFSSFSATEGSNNYQMTNMISNISLFPLESIETRVGLGLGILSYTDESDMQPSFSFDINYYLPINFSGFKFAVNVHGQRTSGYVGPGGVDGDATDFIYIGTLINTPLAF